MLLLGSSRIRDSAGSSTRHVERREFKMRELQKRGKVDLKLVRT